MKLYAKSKNCYDKPTTTVAELMSALSHIDPNSLVRTEGCDCIGNIVGVSVEDDGSILLCRDDDMFEGSGGDRRLKDRYVDRVSYVEDMK